MTAVARQENAAWKLVNAHFSFAIPDDLLIDLMQRASSES
jgi:hypothetical protein